MCYIICRKWLGKWIKLLFFVLDLRNSVALDLFGINNSTSVKVCTALHTSEYFLKDWTILCTCIRNFFLKFCEKSKKKGTHLIRNWCYYFFSTNCHTTVNIRKQKKYKKFNKEAINMMNKKNSRIKSVTA